MKNKTKQRKKKEKKNTPQFFMGLSWEYLKLRLNYWKSFQRNVSMSEN